MLGMMNCPTEAVEEFYSSSPSSARRPSAVPPQANRKESSLSVDGANNERSTTSPAAARRRPTPISIVTVGIGGDEAAAAARIASLPLPPYRVPPLSPPIISEEELLVFSKAKERPHITYTEDGRKFIDGKLVPPPLLGVIGGTSTGAVAGEIDTRRMWERLIMEQHIKMRTRQYNNKEAKRSNSANASKRSTTTAAMKYDAKLTNTPIMNIGSGGGRDTGLGNEKSDRRQQATAAIRVNPTPLVLVNGARPPSSATLPRVIAKTTNNNMGRR